MNPLNDNLRHLGVSRFNVACSLTYTVDVSVQLEPTNLVTFHSYDGTGIKIKIAILTDLSLSVGATENSNCTIAHMCPFETDGSIFKYTMMLLNLCNVLHFVLVYRL